MAKVAILATGVRVGTRICIQESKNHLKVLVYCFSCKSVKPLSKGSFIGEGKRCGECNPPKSFRVTTNRRSRIRKLERVSTRFAGYDKSSEWGKRTF